MMRPARALCGTLLLAGFLAFCPRVDAESPGAPFRGAQSRWHIVESANFRVINYGDAPVASAIAAACEDLRGQLLEQWGHASAVTWSPKCDVVLYPTDGAYLAEVGSQGPATLASALVDRKQGRITLRRIDVRASKTDWLERALPHELAHVVLADRFPNGNLPRWVDEGAAVLADPAEKRHSHARDLQAVLARGRQFRLAELLTLADYPPVDRWDAFYAQSASLVAYLVEREGSAAFLTFVERAGQLGYRAALREVYGQEIGELETHWLAEVRVGPSRSTQPRSGTSLTGFSHPSSR